MKALAEVVQRYGAKWQRALTGLAMLPRTMPDSAIMDLAKIFEKEFKENGAGFFQYREKKDKGRAALDVRMLKKKARMWREIAEIQSNFCISKKRCIAALLLGLKEAKVKLKHKNGEECVDTLQSRLSIACRHLSINAGKVAQGTEPKWFQDIMKEKVDGDGGDESDLDDDAEDDEAEQAEQDDDDAEDDEASAADIEQDDEASAASAAEKTTKPRLPTMQKTTKKSTASKKRCRRRRRCKKPPTSTSKTKGQQKEQVGELEEQMGKRSVPNKRPAAAVGDIRAHTVESKYGATAWLADLAAKKAKGTEPSAAAGLVWPGAWAYASPPQPAPLRRCWPKKRGRIKGRCLAPSGGVGPVPRRRSLGHLGDASGTRGKCRLLPRSRS